MKRTIVLAAAWVLAACSSLVGPRGAEQYFVLGVAGAAAVAPARAMPAVVVAPTSAAGFYDTQDIAYSRAPGTRAYYQFSHWVERPQRVVHTLLAERLQAGGAAGAPLLATRVDEIYHDAERPPGQARITVSAQLIDPASRAVIARRTFSRSAPAASYDAPGAVAGMRQALGELLDELAQWVAGSGP